MKMTTIMFTLLIAILTLTLNCWDFWKDWKMILSKNTDFRESFCVWPNLETSTYLTIYSLDYLTIGEGNKDKRAIILTSRVHPGETMSSYIIEYIIEFLLGNSSMAKSLRDNFVFKIVPMLNPDGVIVGNYRCNLSGADLNRQWIEPSKKAHPTIYFTKQVKTN